MLKWSKVKRPNNGLTLERKGIGSQVQGCPPLALPMASFLGELPELFPEHGLR